MTIRRIKTYAGAQGFVYQYYFVGQREALTTDAAAPASEFVFDVTSDRQGLPMPSAFFFPLKRLRGGAAAHGRSLTGPEQYAAAKVRLFRAFDELEDLKTRGRRLIIDSALLEESLASLGVD